MQDPACMAFWMVTSIDAHSMSPRSARDIGALKSGCVACKGNRHHADLCNMLKAHSTTLCRDAGEGPEPLSTQFARGAGCTWDGMLQVCLLNEHSAEDLNLLLGSSELDDNSSLPQQLVASSLDTGGTADCPLSRPDPDPVGFLDSVRRPARPDGLLQHRLCCPDGEVHSPLPLPACCAQPMVLTACCCFDALGNLGSLSLAA